MSYIRGLVSTADVTSAQMVIDMEKEIAMLEPDQAGLYSFAQFLGKTEKAEQPKFSWLEDENVPYTATINCAAGYAVGDTDIVLDDASYVKIDDLFQNARTREVYRCTAVNADLVTITITRAFGSTAAAAILDNDYLVRVGTVSEEGSDIKTTRTTKTTEVVNYVQIFKDNQDFTGTQNASRMYSGDERARQLRAMAIRHRMDIDRAMMFGEQKVTTGSGGKPLRATKGLLSFISTNVMTDGNGILSRAEWNDFLENYAGKHYNGSTAGQGPSPKKLILCGSIIIEALYSWLDQKVMLDGKWNKLGVPCVEYTTPSGKTFLIKSHKTFNDVPDYQGYAVAIDMENVRIKTLRPTKLTMNMPTTSDKTIDQYLTECGLKVRNEKNFALLKGVTGYSL